MTILDNKIGVIGLGNMGQPIAEHLANAGSEVFAYDIDTDKTATSNSLVVCNSIKEVQNHTSTLLLSLPIYELLNIGMINVESYHLSSAPCGTS